jgi:hypothetical protein
MERWGLSAIEFEEDDFLQVGRPTSPRPGAAVMPNGRWTSANSVEALTDLNLGDLCVLLCGFLFCPVFSESERRA